MEQDAKITEIFYENCVLIDDVQSALKRIHSLIVGSFASTILSRKWRAETGLKEAVWPVPFVVTAKATAH